MTRIIAGVAGGRPLRIPGRGTRPTSDRVREALFSRLEHAGAVGGAVVWDLYAGSGALGLEAASRGAREVVLVESDRAAARVCRQNCTELDLPARVVAQNVLTFLRRPTNGPPTLVFLDPPYQTPETDLGAVLATLATHLAPGAVVVVERSVRNPEPPWPQGLERVDRRRYGDTALWFACPLQPPPIE